MNNTTRDLTTIAFGAARLAQQGARPSTLRAYLAKELELLLEQEITRVFRADHVVVSGLLQEHEVRVEGSRGERLVVSAGIARALAATADGAFGVPRG